MFSTSNEEDKLIKQCRKGDALAQNAVYNKYANRIYALCLRYADSTFEAEDVMIETFTKVFSTIDKYDGKGSFEGWIKRIAINLSLMAYRKRVPFNIDRTSEILADSVDMVETDSGLNVEDLLRLVHELPNGYRQVFNLFAIEGFSHQEISQMLGISEGTSKSQLSRARAILQNNLYKQETLGQKSS